MSQLPAGTFAYRWYNGALSRYQVTLRSTGGSVTHDTTMELDGFSGDHRSLIVSSGTSLRVYDTTTGEFLARAIPSTFSVKAVHPTRPEVVIASFYGGEMQLYNYEADTYTTTAAVVGSNPTVTYTPDGTQAFVANNDAPYLTIYDADLTTPQSNPYTGVTSYINAQRRKSLVFNRVEPLVAMSLTGQKYMQVFDTTTGGGVWSQIDLDTNHAYYMDFNPLGDLMCLTSTAFPNSTKFQIRDAFAGSTVRNFSTATNSGFAGVFTGEGDDIVLLSHPALAGTVVDARTGASMYTLLGAAEDAVALPPYAAPPIVDAFWTQRIRTQEII